MIADGRKISEPLLNDARDVEGGLCSANNAVFSSDRLPEHFPDGSHGEADALFECGEPML